MLPAFRSSELDRILSCNGSITVTRLADPRSGDEGHEGVMLHWLIADRCIRELGAIPPDGGLTPPDVPKGYKMPAFSLWIVDWAVRHVRDTVPEDWALMVELPLSYSYDRWTNSGHIDIVGISPDATESIGVDWKTGRDPVDPAENNEQVGSYLSLKKRAWPTLRKGTFQIAQPRADEDSGFERVSTVTVENLDTLVASIDSRVCAAMDNDMELSTGLKQCRWCVGCSCPAIRKLMKLQLTPEILTTIQKTPDNAVLGDFVIAGRILEKPMKDAKEMLHERLDTVPALTAGDGTQITRKIQGGSYTIDEPVEFFKAAKGLLETDERMASVFKPSLTRLTDEVAEVLNCPKTGKSGITAQSVVDARFKPFVTQGEKRILVFT